MNVDFLFGAQEEVREDAEETELLVEEEGEGGIDDGASCCPAPSSPCEVRHPCCFRLCSSLSLAVRGLTGAPLFSGCCPEDDPCGERSESGNCIQCSTSCQEEEDWMVGRLVVVVVFVVVVVIVFVCVFVVVVVP